MSRKKKNPLRSKILTKLILTKSSGNLTKKNFLLILNEAIQTKLVR